MKLIFIKIKHSEELLKLGEFKKNVLDVIYSRYFNLNFFAVLSRFKKNIYSPPDVPSAAYGLLEVPHFLKLPV